MQRSTLARMLLGVGLLLPYLACSDGVVVKLGDRQPGQGRFGKPRLITELSSPSKSDNPTLTADLLELYFTSDRSGGLGDVWMAKRSARDQKFSAPQPVTAVNTPGFETSSAISGDGLTLWFGSDRPGGSGDLDIWVTTRPTRNAAWSAPSNVKPLNSSSKDIPRPPGQHELVMPPASDRAAPGLYQTYLSERSSRSTPFGAPAILSELTFPDMTTVDAFLTDDGLTLLYSSGAGFGPTDLFVAARETTTQPFVVRGPLAELDTSGDERDPWLSPDGTELYFAADLSGHLEIYVASLIRDTTATTAMP